MRKFYSVIKWFVFVTFSIDLFAGLKQSKAQQIAFTPDQEKIISSLSEKFEGFTQQDVELLCSTFGWMLDRTETISCEKCKKCLFEIDSILISPNYVDALNKQKNGFKFSELMQSVLKHLLVFYMENFYADVSVEDFYNFYRAEKSGYVADLHPLKGDRDLRYVQQFEQTFCTFLCQKERLARSTLKECQTVFEKIKFERAKEVLKGEIQSKKQDADFLANSHVLDKSNPKLLLSSENEICNVLDRLLYLHTQSDFLHTQSDLKFFKFLSLNKNDEKLFNFSIAPDESYVEMNCFLSLEAKAIDVAALTLGLYNECCCWADDNDMWEISLFRQEENEHRKCICREKIKALNTLSSVAISNGQFPAPLLKHLLDGDQVNADKKIELEGRIPLARNCPLNVRLIEPDYAIARPITLTPFRPLTWEGCFRVEQNSVQHALVNNYLEEDDLGKQYLLAVDRIAQNENSQKLVVKLYVYPSDTLLKKAVESYLKMQNKKYPNLMFLGYNEKKSCFELLNVEQYQKQKKVIYGKLEKKYGVLKQGSEKIVNQQRIDELMYALLDQRESATEELDMARVQDVEDLLKNEEEIRKLNLDIEEVQGKNEIVVKGLAKIQGELKERIEGLKELRQKINSLKRKEDLNVDLEEQFNHLRQAHAELENRYKQLQESSKDSKLSESESWGRLQEKSRKNAEDLAAFQHQEAEHEHAWQLYKEEIKQKQEAELRRQQEEAERKAKEEEQKRKAEEERKRKEEQQRKLAEQQRQKEEAERVRKAEEERKRKEEEQRKAEQQRLEKERKEKEELRRQQAEAERRRIEAEQKRQEELKRQQEEQRKAKEEAEQKRKAEEERKRKEEEQRKAEQQRLERERLEREEAERVRKAEEEQRRREEEARKPKGVTGQQIFDYIQRTGTPGKKNAATRLIRANKITPSQLYTNRNQVPPRVQPDFDILMSGQK